jgi:hypothetical protein
MWDEF